MTRLYLVDPTHPTSAWSSVQHTELFTENYLRIMHRQDAEFEENLTFAMLLQADSVVDC
jgi:hypothetical protein